MKPIGIFTIPHTGTRFLMSDVFKNFEQLKLQSNYHHPDYGVVNDYDTIKFYCEHVFNHMIHAINKYCEQCEAIAIPLRSPHKIVRSWLIGDSGWSEEIELIHCWNNLINVVDRKFNPFYICIDRPKLRDIQLQKLSDKIGINLQTDWNPVGESTFLKKDIEGFDYQIPVEWKRFYEDKCH